MNLGPVSTPTPTNCLPLTQWKASGISKKITKLLTFLHSNYVNFVSSQETKLTNKTEPLKTPGLAAVRLDSHKNNGDGLLMLIKDMIPSSTTRPLFHSQPILIWSNKTFWLRCPIANNCTSTTSTFCHVAVAALVITHRSLTSSATMRCRLLLWILMRITPDGIQIQPKTKEANN